MVSNIEFVISKNGIYDITKTDFIVTAPNKLSPFWVFSLRYYAAASYSLYVLSRYFVDKTILW